MNDADDLRQMRNDAAEVRAALRDRVSELETENARLLARQQGDEAQLVEIAAYFGEDARNYGTIAAMVKARVDRLKQACEVFEKNSAGAAELFEALKGLLVACDHDSDGMGPRVLDAMERANEVLRKPVPADVVTDAVRDERRACADLAETLPVSYFGIGPEKVRQAIAAAIRARGEDSDAVGGASG